jgi:hypothetical protein
LVNFYRKIVPTGLKTHGFDKITKRLH